MKRLTITVDAFLRSVPQDRDRRIAFCQAWIVVTAMSKGRMFLWMEQALAEAFPREYNDARIALLTPHQEETTTHE